MPRGQVTAPLAFQPLLSSNDRDKAHLADDLLCALDRLNLGMGLQRTAELESASRLLLSRLQFHLNLKEGVDLATASLQHRHVKNGDLPEWMKESEYAAVARVKYTAARPNANRERAPKPTPKK